MFKKIFYSIWLSFLSLVLSTPWLAWAAQAQTFKEFMDDIVNVMENIIPVVISIIILLFMWSGFLFLKHRSEGNDKLLEEDKKILFWSVIALFVAVSVWGLVFFLVEAFFGTKTLENTLPYPKNLISTL